jgi:phenylacetate-CoA ligase
MSKVNNIYKLLPVFLQNIMISAYGFYWKCRRFGGFYENELKNFQNREKYTKIDFVNYQTLELRKLLLHAMKTVPYYTKLFSYIGLNKAKIESFELTDLHMLPFLSKDSLRQHGTGNLISKTVSKGRAFYASSGSTGTPVQILYTHDLHQKMNAAMEIRVRNWAGVSYKDARGMIGGRRVVPDGVNVGPFYRYNIFEKQVYYSAYHIRKKTVKDYVTGLEKHKVKWLTGYAMSNFFLARFIEETGIKAPQLQAVITSSEKLTSEMRDTFKRVYGCRTYDSYSGVEACGLISECEMGRLHISPEVGIIELLDNLGNPIQPGEVGDAVCTGLLNFDQPLIRYQIGDRIRLSKNQHCDCGREMPIIDEIVGRTEDTVIGPDGREMVRFHGIFVGIQKIVEGQVIQHNLSDFTIKLVVSSSLSKIENELIITRMSSQLGNITVGIHEVDYIPRTSNGKFKAVISNVKRN